MDGYEYYADDPFGYPNGYTNVPLAGNGFSANQQGCREACDANALGFDCVVFMAHPGDNCYLFAEGVATGWNEQSHTSANDGWTTYRKCSSSCPNDGGMAGFEYMTGLSGQPDGDPYGYPSGFQHTSISSGGGDNPAACRQMCNDNALGFECVAFFVRAIESRCYMFPEGAANGWADGSPGGSGYTTYRKCSGSDSGLGLRTAASDCNECGPGRYEGSQGSSSCTGCGAGRYHEAPGARTSNEDCTACEAGQYQGSTASTSCNPCSAGSYRTGEGGNAANQCIAWSALLPTIFHESCRPSIRSISKLIGSFGHCLQRGWSCEHTRYHWPRQLHRMQRREIHIRDRRHRRRRFGTVRAVLSGQIRR